MLSLDGVSRDDDDFRYYTGLTSRKIFNAIYQHLFSNVMADMRYVGKKGGDEVFGSFRRGGTTLLSQEEQLFLVLVRLRRGLHGRDLARRFGVSEATVSRIWDSWLPLMADRLQHIDIWPSKEYISNTMSAAFAAVCPETRVILDCTELRVEMASSFRAQSETFSSYKHYNTAKGLVGISPNGAVTFVSKLYGGRSSDKAIVRHCGILDLLEEGDGVMADRGFDIEEDVAARGTLVLRMPPFLLGRAQLSVGDEVKTRQIAHLRIQVERVIRRIKVFKILASVFPLSMSSSLSQIWTICAYLTNFLPPVVAKLTPEAPGKLPDADDSDATSSSDTTGHHSEGRRTDAATSPAYVDSHDSDTSSHDSMVHVPFGADSVPEYLDMCTQIDFDGLVYLFLPPELSQSTIDGRNGSNACTVIAALVCRMILLRVIYVPPPGFYPEDVSNHILLYCHQLFCQKALSIELRDTLLIVLHSAHI